MANEILHVPTPARSPEEKRLLDEIANDSDLKDPGLRKRAKAYIERNNSYVLTTWRHGPANIFFYSFEDAQQADATRKSYSKDKPRPEPKIMGILKEIPD